MVRTACTEPQCLYKGALYLTVELHLYSPHGPYGLYKGALYLYYLTGTWSSCKVSVLLNKTGK
jgi:hypothetical protein